MDNNSIGPGSRQIHKIEVAEHDKVGQVYLIPIKNWNAPSKYNAIFVTKEPEEGKYVWGLTNAVEEKGQLIAKKGRKYDLDGGGNDVFGNPDLKEDDSIAAAMKAFTENDPGFDTDVFVDFLNYQVQSLHRVAMENLRDSSRIQKVHLPLKTSEFALVDTGTEKRTVEVDRDLRNRVVNRLIFVRFNELRNLSKKCQTVISEIGKAQTQAPKNIVDMGVSADVDSEGESKQELEQDPFETSKNQKTFELLEKIQNRSIEISDNADRAEFNSAERKPYEELDFSNKQIEEAEKLLSNNNEKLTKYSSLITLKNDPNFGFGRREKPGQTPAEEKLYTLLEEFEETPLRPGITDQLETAHEAVKTERQVVLGNVVREIENLKDQVSKLSDNHVAYSEKDSASFEFVSVQQAYSEALLLLLNQAQLSTRSGKIMPIRNLIDVQQVQELVKNQVETLARQSVIDTAGNIDEENVRNILKDAFSEEEFSTTFGESLTQLSGQLRWTQLDNEVKALKARIDPIESYFLSLPEDNDARSACEELSFFKYGIKPLDNTAYEDDVQSFYEMKKKIDTALLQINFPNLESVNAEKEMIENIKELSEIIQIASPFFTEDQKTGVFQGLAAIADGNEETLERCSKDLISKLKTVFAEAKEQYEEEGEELLSDNLPNMKEGFLKLRLNKEKAYLKQISQYQNTIKVPEVKDSYKEALNKKVVTSLINGIDQVKITVGHDIRGAESLNGTINIILPEDTRKALDALIPTYKDIEDLYNKLTEAKNNAAIREVRPGILNSVCKGAEASLKSCLTKNECTKQIKAEVEDTVTMIHKLTNESIVAMFSDFDDDDDDNGNRPLSATSSRTGSFYFVQDETPRSSQGTAPEDHKRAQGEAFDKSSTTASEAERSSSTSDWLLSQGRQFLGGLFSRFSQAQKKSGSSIPLDSVRYQNTFSYRSTAKKTDGVSIPCFNSQNGDQDIRGFVAPVENSTWTDNPINVQDIITNDADKAVELSEEGDSSEESDEGSIQSSPSSTKSTASHNKIDLDDNDN